LITKTVIGTPMSDDAFFGFVMTTMTLSGGKIRAHDNHFFVVNSREDR
jgi:hypothetical protein